MVTHLPAEAAELAGRVAVMSPRPGRIVDIVANDLPRPRSTRSAGFYKLEDKLESLIRN
jgi:NitT/TauT family transport system ATP-binding protein